MGCAGNRPRIRTSSRLPGRWLASCRSMEISWRSPRRVASGRHRSPSIADPPSVVGGRSTPWMPRGHTALQPWPGPARHCRSLPARRGTGSASGHRSMALPGAGRARCRTSSRRPRSRSRPDGWAIGGLDISTGCASAGPTIGLTWTSPDGRTWTRLRDDPSGVISALARRGDTLVGLGIRTATHAKRPGAVWTMHVDAPPSAVTSRPTRVPDGGGCGG